jgi:hypothetical protein
LDLCEIERFVDSGFVHHIQRVSIELDPGEPYFPCHSPDSGFLNESPVSQRLLAHRQVRTERDAACSFSGSVRRDLDDEVSVESCGDTLEQGFAVVAPPACSER